MPIPPRTPLITLMRLEAKHVASLNKVLTEAVKDLDKKIAGMANANPITMLQAQAQRAAMKDFLGQTFDTVEDVARVGMVEAARAASGVVSQYEDELLKLVLDPKTMGVLAKSEAKRAAAGLEAALKRMQGTSYKPLSKTVYDSKQLANGWVDNTINKALASGWSRQQLAAELKKSINPKVPGGVSYAANRTARTEINNAFHASSAERYMNSMIVESVDWHLSSSHPEGDVCDTLQDESPYPKKSVPQKPHPNCYCFITPHLPTEEEFLDKLFAGDYDDGKTWVDDVKPEMKPSKIFPGMSKGEEDAVARYTRDSFKFNDDLRHGKKPADTDLLDSAFQHAALARATTVRRVVAGDPARDALSTTKNSKPRYTDPAFMSTQKMSHGSMEDLIDEFGQERGTTVVFEIRLPKGAKAIDISGKLDDHPEALGYNQGEVLLPRDMEFRMGQPQTVGDWRDDIVRIVLTPVWDTMKK